jgi:autotransporter-associated beta strand protein
MHSDIPDLIISSFMNTCRFWFVVLMLAITLAGPGSAQAFVHPGIPLTASDLDAVKTNLTRQPWASGYAALQADGHASLNYTMQGPFDYVSRNEGGMGFNINLTQWDNDMQAIYYLSLMWCFTSNSAYAQKSHDIMMAWADTLTNFGGYEGVFQLGGTAQRYVTGADILRGTWPGWTTSDTTNLQRFFTNVYWPPLSVPKTLLSANQGGFQQMGAVAIAAFCDDTNRLNEAIYSLVNDGDTGFRDSLANGEVGDTQRDQGHSYNMVWQLAWPAEVLWKQGIDVFSIFDNRVLATSEYYCRYNVPGPTPPFVQLSAPFTSYMTTNIGGAPRSSGQNRLVFNIVHAAYAVRKGICAPWTGLYLNDLNESAESFMYRKVADTSTATPLSLPMTFPPTASLTTGLTSANLNGTTPAGSTTYNNATKTWTLSSGYGGKDPWYSAGNDTVRFAYKQITGDFTMVARVTSVANVGSVSAKGGLMMRDSLGTATNRIWVGMIASGNYERALIGWTHLGYGANNAQMSVPTTGFPYWVKLERIGQRVHTFTSSNGGDWSPASVADFPTMPNTMYVGLFGTSLVTGTASTATFTDVRITGGDGGEAPKIPPTPFAVYAGAGDAQVQLRWNESFNAASYNVKRSTTSGSGYATVASVTNTTWTDTTVTNGVTYSYAVTAVNAAGESAPTVQDSATPQLAMVNVATGGSAQDDSGNANGTEGAIRAFDINPSSKWLGTSTGWLQYDLGSFVRHTIRRYAVTSANDVPGRDPKNWQLLASNDGANWTTLDVQTNQTFTYRYQTLTYPLANTNAFRYYRLDVLANNGENSAQLGELALLAIPGTGTNLTTGELVWSGAISSAWNTTTANWLSNNTAAVYQNGSAVVFDDAATGSTSVTLASALTPLSASFNNSSKNYAVAGSPISGSAALVKAGIGTLTVNNANAFSGGTTLVDGTLMLGNAGALGTGVVRINGGTLNNNLANLTLTNAITVNGSVNVYAANGVNFNLTGPLSGTGTIVNSLANQNSSLTLSGDLDDFTGTIIYNDANNTYNNLNLGGGTANSMNASQARIIVSGGSNLARKLTLNGTPFQLGDLSGTGGTVAINGTLAVGSLNLDSTFAGMFQNTTGNLIKAGTGTLTLPGANAYTGQTIVSNGALVISTAFVGKGNFLVTNSATLGVSNLSAASALLSSIVTAAGTTLEFLNVSSTTTPPIVASNLTIGGSCVVRITGTNDLVSGSAYPLVSYSGALSGSFANLQLQMPYGWRGTLAQAGKQIVLANVAVVATTQPQLTVMPGALQLQLDWADTHTGWRLEAQTNAPGSGLGTNWVTVPGSAATNQMFLPNDPSNGSVFFRLVYP